MVHGHADQWPSTEGAAWPLWWHIFRKQPQRVKRQAQKRQAIEFKAYKEQAAVDVCKWYMYRQIKVEALHEEPATTWLCRVCDRVFKTKAALSVHFFKTHGRCAGYRHYLQGTKCEGCNKEFWTRGRLEDHLRASAKCVRILRRTRRPQDSAPQAEHFTPAPPAGGCRALIDEEDSVWSSWQKELHEDLCDALLAEPDGVDVWTKLDNRVRRRPLYPEEIQDVLTYLKSEVELIHADRDLAQWSDEQMIEIRNGLQRLLEKDPTEAPRTQRGSKGLQTMAGFRRTVLNFDWHKACQQQQGDNVTRTAPLFILPACWETVWQHGRDGRLTQSWSRSPCFFSLNSCVSSGLPS